jgi:hypothetical protein
LLAALIFPSLSWGENNRHYCSVCGPCRSAGFKQRVLRATADSNRTNRAIQRCVSPKQQSLFTQQGWLPSRSRCRAVRGTPWRSWRWTVRCAQRCRGAAPSVTPLLRPGRSTHRGCVWAGWCAQPPCTHPCPCTHGTQDTVAALKKAFHAKKPKAYPARQRLTLPPAPGQKSGEVLKDGAKLAECGLSSGSVVQFKDLGPQVRGVGLGHLASCAAGPWCQRAVSAHGAVWQLADSWGGRQAAPSLSCMTQAAAHPRRLTTDTAATRAPHTRLQLNTDWLLDRVFLRVLWPHGHLPPLLPLPTSALPRTQVRVAWRMQAAAAGSSQQSVPGLPVRTPSWPDRRCWLQGLIIGLAVLHPLHRMTPPGSSACAWGLGGSPDAQQAGSIAREIHTHHT